MILINKRSTGYSASVKAANVDGVQGKELFITLRTRNCDWRERTGGCDFCGLGNLDGKQRPLTSHEVILQVRNVLKELDTMGVATADIVTVSLISMSDSLLNPYTIETEALRRTIALVAEHFPNIRLLLVESRVDSVMPEPLRELGQFIDSLFGSRIRKGLACGIDTPYQRARVLALKGILDSDVTAVMPMVAYARWNELRGYFIYNLFEHTPDTRILALKDAVDMMHGLELGTPVVTTSILVLRGYVPDSLREKKRFRDFQEVEDTVALAELKIAAWYAATKGVPFEFDSTSADQIAASASIMSPAYRAALDRYNLMRNPNELVLK